MFCHENALKPSITDPISVDPFIRYVLNDFLLENELQAGILCEWNEDRCGIDYVVIEGFPESPFIGSRQESLKHFIVQCLECYPAPHLHSAMRSDLWSEIAAVHDLSSWQSKTAFLPVSSSTRNYVLILFSESTISMKEQLYCSCSEVVETISQLRDMHSIKHKLRVMELYVREIGHDIASSVQAIISKLNAVSRGYITGRLANEKIKEAEEEIMSTYRIADTLGITVDPDYNIGNGKEFDAREVIARTVSLCKSEAEERHIDLRTGRSTAPIFVWGDEKAIQSALTQYVINAIKYGKGSSYINIYARKKDKQVEFIVQDIGEPIEDIDKAAMWEFGWRGDRAKEYHVNGSGIGLFTVKKIVQAHGGICEAYSDEENKHIVTFSFSIPEKDIIRKTQLL